MQFTGSKFQSSILEERSIDLYLKDHYIFWWYFDDLKMGTWQLAMEINNYNFAFRGKKYESFSKEIMYKNLLNIFYFSWWTGYELAYASSFFMVINSSFM